MKTVEEIAKSLGLNVIEKVTDPSYPMIHIYTKPNEGVDWDATAEKLAKQVFEELRVTNKVYRGRKHPDLYNFSAIDDE